MWIFGKKDTEKPVAPETENDSDTLRIALQSIAEMITAVHRISHGFNASSIADEDERDKLTFRMEFLQDEARRAAMENGLQVPDLVGVEISPTLSVTVDNGGDFTPEDKLIVTAVMEPLITYGQYTLKHGRVLAGLAPQETPGANL